MAGKRKAEGIALLAAYGGDDDDPAASTDDDDDDEEEEQKGEERERPVRSGGSPKTEQMQNGEGADAAPRLTTVSSGSSAPVVGFGIVDYAQDEGFALSPGAEDGDFLGRGTALDGDSDLQADNRSKRESATGAQTTVSINVSPLQLDRDTAGLSIPTSETPNVQDKQTEDGTGVHIPESESVGQDCLNSFLPPPPLLKYSGELQVKFSKYLALKKSGKSLNEVLRNSKDYRNPDFLQSAVQRFDIDHIGSCFKKEVFDPHGYDPGDYYDAIALEVRRDGERKEQERRQTQRVDFVRSTIQTTVTVEKPIVPTVHKVITVSSSETSGKADGRSSKKSKWDKVELEGGRTTQMTSSTADAIAAANAHAAFLTASSNAGAGYASFAQQRRREAEEMSRANEKHASSVGSKLERKAER